ncbi:hypothetical protein CDL12_15991 [Handroanthus impetiginosus]|uniref:BTB domain-containing protein n=1 Tax=Handroanthus impetiginosus TaxID=429701 RepID=A0A2G9H1L0_9LAMI|nr:hypothetical protein CDL12_15991 [Handroanthus impetiginosus]
MTSELVSESVSTTVRRLENGSYEFVIKKHSLHRGIGVNKAIESEEFTVGGQLWTICLFPDRKCVDAYNAGDVSLYISLNSDSSTPLYHVWISTFQGSLESYVKDDCIIISVKIGVFNSHIQMLPLIKVPPSSNIGADLGKLLEGKRGPPGDVLFKIATDGESFRAHKSVLAARSPVFLSLLPKDHAHRPPHEIVIRDAESRVFKAMLWFMYTGTLPEEEGELEGDLSSDQSTLESFMGKMFAVANQYKLKRLTEICESCLMDRISEESVTYLLHLAYAYHATQL